MGALARLNALKEAPDTVVASVVWRNETLFRIGLIRRGDCGVALIAVPTDLGSDLRSLNVEAVFRHAMLLHRMVGWALPDAAFAKSDVFAETVLRDGVVPAELGNLRRWAASVIGVDIGEFPIPLRRRLI